MTPYRTLIYLIKRKRHYKKLIFPFAFFSLEIMLIALVSLNIFGINIFSFWFDAAIDEPLIFTNLLHSYDVFEQYKIGYSLFILNQNVEPFLVLLNLISLVVAIVGLIISLLWMSRFFKLNNLNIEWWVWPAGCAFSHLLFFVVAI